jgi:2-polyprenyl-3-methyl-5-hydroxy-6-metoxy-1,4-benzoquinol methylase
MALNNSNQSIEQLIDELKQVFLNKSPELFDLFLIYANEALFMYNLIKQDLEKLNENDEILEVGAGIFLLCCQLKKQGYNITALEPNANGFSYFYNIQKIIIDYASDGGFLPPVIKTYAENLSEENRFKFIYSMNVMEHVSNIETTLEKIFNALSSGGYYRFICPNYSFPYEGHFGIPIIINKKITKFIMSRKIKKYKLPEGNKLWESLNWINISKIKKICKKLHSKPNFNSEITNIYLNRVINDKFFRTRHSSFFVKFLVKIMFILKFIGIFNLIKFLPPQILPIIDCKIFKK